MDGTAVTKGVPLASRLDLLHGHHALSGLSGAAATALAGALEPVRCAAGTVLAHQGDDGDALYLVVSGRLHARRSDGVAVEAGPGEVVGEVALVRDGARAATLTAVRDCELLRLGRHAFARLVRRYPPLLVALSGLAVSRLAETGKDTMPIRTVAVVSVGGAPLGAFCRDLARALRPIGAVAEVSSGRLRRRGARTMGAQRTAALDAERRHRFVVYRADRRPTAWSRWCVRQADCVLEVADGTGTPIARSSDELPLGDHVVRRLVLVHPAATSLPRGTAAWLAARPVHAHHHVRPGSAPDFARLARLVTGEATALVLGGGGARGFAHLGVMHGLEAAGVAIDAVGGTSVGSLMGAGLAMGWDHTARMSRAVGAVQQRLLRPTLPLLALSSARTFTEKLRDVFGDVAIEDLWLPFFCVSTSLSSGEPVVHDRGPLWLALRASTSLPGIVPPVFHEGDLLVDGGITDNLPVATMRRRVRGRVIAVDLEAHISCLASDPFSPTISGWRVLAGRLTPRRRSRKVVPLAPRILARSKEVASRWAQRQPSTAAAADLVIRPATDDVGVLAFGDAPPLIAAGEEACREALVAGRPESFDINQRERTLSCCS